MILANNQINDRENAKKLVVDHASIKFDNASYSYEDGKVAIANFSLTVNPGEKLVWLDILVLGRLRLLNCYLDSMTLVLDR